MDLKLTYKGLSEFEPPDFQDMELNPFAVPKGSFIYNFYDFFKRKKVFKELPKEKAYKDWMHHDLDLLLKVIILMVDTESPLADEADFDHRKIQSVLVLKANRNARVLKEVDSEGIFFSFLVYEFFKSISDMDYESWYSLKMLYHELCRQARRPMSPNADAGEINARAKLPTAIASTEAELKAKQVSLFKSKRLEKILINESARDEVGGWPEEFAEEPEWKQLINSSEDGEEEEDS